MNAAISPTDAFTILQGIKQFGLAPDGADLRDLQAALDALDKDRSDILVILKQLRRPVQHDINTGKGLFSDDDLKAIDAAIARAGA